MEKAINKKTEEFMRAHYSICIFLCSIFFILSVKALKMDILENRDTCFIEHLNKKSKLELRYEVLNNGNPMVPISMHVTIIDPSGNVAVEKEWTVTTVKMTHLAADADGQYTICLKPKGISSQSNENNVHRLQLSLGVNNEANEYDSKESKDRLKQIRVLLQKVTEQLGSVEHDQYYFKNREERFRVTLDTIYTRTWLFFLLQIMALMGTGVWQVYAMRSFFIKRELI